MIHLLQKNVNVIHTECATSKLVEECHLDKNELSELIYNEIINQNDIKKIDCKKIALKVVKSNNIENVLEKVLLTDYFTSNAVIKTLNEQSKKKLNNNKIKNKDINLLVKPVKNSGVRYKLT